MQQNDMCHSVPYIEPLHILMSKNLPMTTSGCIMVLRKVLCNAAPALLHLYQDYCVSILTGDYKKSYLCSVEYLIL